MNITNDNRLEIVEIITQALQERFGEQWNVAIPRLYIGDNVRFSVYMELEPGGRLMPTIERTYRDKCHRAGLEEDWIYQWVKLAGVWWQIIGWHSNPVLMDNPIILKTVPGYGFEGASHIQLKVHQLRKLAYDGRLEFEKPSFEEEE